MELAAENPSGEFTRGEKKGEFYNMPDNITVVMGRAQMKEMEEKKGN